MNLSKEQLVESLSRLRDYSYWMYYGKNCQSMLEKKTVEHDGHKFKISLTDYGLIEMTLENGVRCLYDAQIVTAPLRKDSIENLDIQVKIMNKSDLTEEYIKYFTKAGVFVSSFFQRSAAFTFLSRMHDETVDAIANDLTFCNK